MDEGRERKARMKAGDSTKQQHWGERECETAQAERGTQDTLSLPSLYNTSLLSIQYFKSQTLF